METVTDVLWGLLIASQFILAGIEIGRRLLGKGESHDTK